MGFLTGHHRERPKTSNAFRATPAIRVNVENSGVAYGDVDGLE